MKTTETLKISKLDLIRPVFNPDELIALRAFNSFIQDHHQIIFDEVRSFLFTLKTFGPILHGITENEFMELNKQFRKIEREAILINYWDAYSEYLLKLGRICEKRGIGFTDWFTVIRIYKNCTFKMIEVFGGGAFSIVRGLTLTTDFAMSVIGEAYVDEKK